MIFSLLSMVVLSRSMLIRSSNPGGAGYPLDVMPPRWGIPPGVSPRHVVGAEGTPIAASRQNARRPASGFLRASDILASPPAISQRA